MTTKDASKANRTTINDLDIAETPLTAEEMAFAQGGVIGSGCAGREGTPTVTGTTTTPSTTTTPAVCKCGLPAGHSGPCQTASNG
ncbi:MAG: hypothetical protein U0Y68_03300 [Blastocatellia bacterium]